MNRSTDAEQNLHDQAVAIDHQETLYHQGDHFFTELIQEIDSAQFTIDMEVYIFQLDRLGTRVMESLIAAAERGVQVRLLLDGFGAYVDSPRISKALEDVGAHVRIYHPLPWQWIHYRRALHIGHSLNQALYFLRKMNRRDHRKLCLIDRKALWTGSFNVSAAHLSYETGGQNWRDTGVRIQGEMASDMAITFSHFWDQRRELEDHPFKRYWSNITHAARLRKNKSLKKMIAHSQQRVWVMSAYFAPSGKVVRALKSSAKRGVDVVIIVPARSDVHWFPWLTASYYQDLLNAGIRIFEYQPHVVHAKVLIADDQCVVGSTNFNHRSYLHDLELDVFLQTAHCKKELEQQFLQDLKHCEAITFKHKKLNIRNKMLGIVARLVRYWM